MSSWPQSLPAILALGLALGLAELTGCGRGVGESGGTISAEDCRPVAPERKDGPRRDEGSTTQARVDSIKRLSEGIQRVQRNDLAGAERAMTNAIETDPTHAEAYLNLGKVYRKQHEWRDAENAFRGAIDNMGDDPRGDYYFELGTVQVAQSVAPGTGQAEQRAGWREAITSFSKAVDLDPGLFAAHYQMGALYERLDEPHEADQAYRACIEINSRYSPCYVSLGNMYVDYGFSSDAMAVLEAGAAVNPTDVDMWSGVGRALLNLDRPREAVDAYERARQIDPDKAEVLFGLGMAYAEIPMREEALEVLAEFLDKAGPAPDHIKMAAQDTIMRMLGPI